MTPHRTSAAPHVTVVWVALGIAVGLALGHARRGPAPPVSWPECLTSFGGRVAQENVSTDDDNGVDIKITGVSGEWMAWSLYPDEARQLADYLYDNADAAERAMRGDAGTEL